MELTKEMIAVAREKATAILAWMVNNKDQESFFVTDTLISMADWADKHRPSPWRRIHSDVPEANKFILVRHTEESLPVVAQRSDGEVSFASWTDANGEKLNDYPVYWMEIPE